MRSRQSPAIVVPRGDRLYDPATLARLCRARDYLADHYNEHCTLEEISAYAGFSPFHFTRLFTQFFDETPHELVTRLRIDRAKKLLLAGNHSVTDICFDIGYESLGTFSTRFRSLTGLSPAAFRSEARRTFGGFGKRWPLYYVPVCYQHFFAGI